MGVIAASILICWVVGIVAMAAAITYVLRTSEEEIVKQVRLAAEVNPAFVYGYLSVLVVFWPAWAVFQLFKSKGQ